MERPLMRLILRTTLKKYYPLLLLSLQKIDFAKSFGKPSSCVSKSVTITTVLYQKCNLSEITEIFLPSVYFDRDRTSCPISPINRMLYDGKKDVKG